MHDVVKSMLNRMESYPEEFVPHKGHKTRFKGLLDEVLKHAEPEDQVALRDKVRQIKLGFLHQDFLGALCDEASPDQVEVELAQVAQTQVALLTRHRTLLSQMNAAQPEPPDSWSYTTVGLAPEPTNASLGRGLLGSLWNKSK